MRTFVKVTVTKKAEESLKGGHPWVYADEVLPHPNVSDGSLVDVYSEKERYLGTGFINSHSKIRIRVISNNANDTFDEAFWKRRISYALSFRRTVMGDDFNCCRLIFGEADGFPGLTVDKFEQVLVTQVLSLGIERIKPLLYRLLVEALRENGETIAGIYERNDVKIRVLEGMEEYTAPYLSDDIPFNAPCPEKQIIRENGIRYHVDIQNGQKTGFFLDQKYNRLAVAKLARGKRVLDCFTHTGAFALNAAVGGATEVTAVDISDDAVETTRANIALNGMEDRVSVIKMDVFDLLDSLLESKKHPYDLIILDPPAFTKSRDTLKNAIRGYKEINLKAIRILGRGGYLATCSCSHFMTDTYFKQMMHNAAAEAGVSLKQIEGRRQSPDHPILWNVPETDYLKFYLFQIV